MEKQKIEDCLLDVFFEAEYQQPLQAICNAHRIADINTLRKWAQLFNREKQRLAFRKSTNEKWLELFADWLKKQPNTENPQPYKP